MPTLDIIRGLPGAGKSTYAQSILASKPNTTHFEADMFFGPDYNWSGDFLSHAHKWCYSNVLQSLYIGNDCIVSNTFTTEPEVWRYLDLVDLIPNLTINLIELHTNYGSIHNVPDEAITRMRKRWEPFDDLPFASITKVTEPTHD